MNMQTNISGFPPEQPREWHLIAALTVFLIAVSTMLGSIVILTAPASANGSGAAYDQSARFVRIGLNKTIVVRLPVAARDVLVGNPEVVNAVVRTKHTAYLFAKKTGETNAFFFDAEGRQILSLDIEVSHDTKGLQALISRHYPGTRIKVDTLGENIVIGGVARSTAEAKAAYDLAVRFTGQEEKVLSTVKVTGKDQVMLKVRIAELQRDVLKQFGVDSQQLFQIGNLAANFVTVNPFTLGAGALNPSQYRTTYTNGTTTIDTIVRAMERDGILRTLAEPTLTAVSGEAAKFLAGGEFPIPVAADADTISVEYKPFGVGLGFTPVVLSEGRISLRVNTEVSELSNEASVIVGAGNNRVAIPSLKVRRAETTVELPSGGSMVMAGLIKQQTKQSLEGIPGVKNLPVLGTLFRSRDFLANQTEMVVIVTPYVVNPVNERQLATPIDRLNVATDRQTILFGRLNKVYGVEGGKPGGTYHGNVGFIVE